MADLMNLAGCAFELRAARGPVPTSWRGDWNQAPDSRCLLAELEGLPRPLSMVILDRVLSALPIQGRTVAGGVYMNPCGRSKPYHACHFEAFSDFSV